MSYDDDGNYVSWMREEVARVSEDCVKRCDAVVVLVLSPTDVLATMRRL